MSIFKNQPTDPKDVQVVDPPSDSISCLEFSYAGEYLAVGSWDNTVRIYETTLPGQTRGIAMYQQQGPVLSLCWSKDGTKVVSGGADNTAYLHDLKTGQSLQVAQHDAPIKSVKWIEMPQGNFLATGSWDKTLKYWDFRSPTPVSTINLTERCYAMDVVYPLMVVGTADKYLQIYNLTNPTVVYQTIKSPLSQQIRVITCFPSGSAYALGSIEGRIAIQYLEGSRHDSYTFRCHRFPSDTNKSIVNAFAINDISFHPTYETFSTAGADGSVSIWDGNARSRIHHFESTKTPISATAFNRSGKILAYAVSYDWSRGHKGMIPNHPNKVMLHYCKDEEVKSRPKAQTRN